MENYYSFHFQGSSLININRIEENVFYFEKVKSKNILKYVTYTKTQLSTESWSPTPKKHEKPKNRHESERLIQYPGLHVPANY